MSGLPRISGRECIKAFGKKGFYLKRQEGSHMILRRDEPFAQVVVPDHKNLIAARCVQLFDNLD
jgi:predicted RNA binding protein YcfA (HicA-like mRNA interferase family)